MQSRTKRLSQKQVANRLIFIQFMVALAIFALMTLFGSVSEGKSALIAGVICVLANAYFANRLFRFQGAQQVKQFMQAYFWGELVKLFIVVALLLLALLSLKVPAMPLFLTFVILQVMMSFTPLVLMKI